MRYLVILTVQNSRGQASITRTPTVDADATRSHIPAWARQELAPEMRDGTTLFFYAEPDVPGGAS